MEIQSARSLNIFPSRPEPEPGKAEGQSRRLAHVAHTCGEKKAEAQESGQAPRGQDQEALFFRGSAGANCQARRCFELAVRSSNLTASQ